jgi:hypothetical protein
MTKPKLTLHKALDLLRQPGSRMVRTNGNGDDLKRSEHWITPACVRVDPKLAERIKLHPQVIAGKDGIWPGHDQTWRIGDE